MYVYVDEVIPPLGVITVGPWSTLHLVEGMDHEINCTHLFLAGGQLITGHGEHEFQSKVTINLLGDTSTYDMPLGEVVMGAKAIGVFGFLGLSGKDVGVPWTKLAETAAAGTSTLKLKEAVTWEVGAEVVVTTSSFRADEAEVFTITSISADNLTLTLDGNLAHDHNVAMDTIDGEVITTAPEVGLLTRNIQINGADSVGM